MTNTYDALVIGTGQAGPSLANRLNAEGLRTAVIERGRLGGCRNLVAGDTSRVIRRKEGNCADHDGGRTDSRGRKAEDASAPAPAHGRSARDQVGKMTGG